ncbi:hypothetical protein Tco_0487940 [Tanacetum coccineum]
MASDSSSQNQPKQLTPASNVPFQVEDCIIKFNNRVALMETNNDAYKPLLQFLKNSSLFVALTKQPSTYYSKYLREFWYTVEADTTSKFITFTLLHFDKPLSFDCDTFSSLIGFDRSDEFVDIPSKETWKAGLATLGLVNEDHPSLSSSDLINSSPVKVKCFSSTWKVVDLSPKPIQYLIPPSREVNADDTADKSLSGTYVQPVT